MNRESLLIVDGTNHYYFLNQNHMPSITRNQIVTAYQNSPKTFSIIISGKEYKVNKKVISKLSLIVYDIVKNDPNTQEISFNISDDKNYRMSEFEESTCDKVFNVINGYKQTFDYRSEYTFLTKIFSLLNMVQPTPRKNDVLADNFHELSIDLFLLTNFIHNYKSDFTLKFGDSEFKTNKIVLSLSDVLLEEFHKNPYLDSFTFESLDNTNGELAPIVDFLSMNNMTITSNNVEIISNAAKIMKIKPIIELAEAFLKNYSKSQRLYDRFEDRLNVLIDLQELLFNLTEENFEDSLSDLLRSVWISSKEYVKAFVSNLCNAYMYCSSSRKPLVHLIQHLRSLDILTEMNNDDFFFQFLVNYSISLSCNSFLICPLLYDLYETAKMIDKDTLVKKIYQAINLDFNVFSSSYSLLWFLPEVDEKYPFIFDLINWDKGSYFQYIFNLINDNINKLKKDNWSLFKKNRSLMINPDPFAIVIINDDLEKFQKMSNDISFDFSYKINISVFDNINEMTLIDYAALHGSLKCFKYMLLNKGNVRNITYYYAVIGNCVEIIHLVDNEIGNGILIDLSNNGLILPNFEYIFYNYYVKYGNYRIQLNKNRTNSRISAPYINNSVYNLETVLVACIIYHRDEVFEWLMNKYLSNNKDSNNILTLCVLTSISYNNVKIFMLILDSGLFSSDSICSLLEDICLEAALNGFVEIVCLVLSIFGNKIFQNPFDKTIRNISYIISMGMKEAFSYFNIRNISSIYSAIGYFGSVKLISKLKNEFIQASNNCFKDSLMTSIHEGNFDFALYISNLCLLGIDQLDNVSIKNASNSIEISQTSSYEGSQSDSVDTENNNDNNLLLISRPTFTVSKLILKELLLNSIKSLNDDNVSFFERLISILDEYNEIFNNKVKICELFDKNIISAGLEQAAFSNNIKFFGWILNKFSDLISIRLIEIIIKIASRFGFLEIINICFTVISCLLSGKKIMIDVAKPNYVKDNEIAIDSKIILQSMELAAEFGFYEVIQFFLENIPSSSKQYLDNTFEIALKCCQISTCKLLLRYPSLKLSAKLLILSAKSNIFELFKKIIDINHSPEFLNSYSNGETLLSVAIYHSSNEIIEYLLKNYSDNIDPNLCNRVMLTPLCIAAFLHRLDILYLLINTFKNRLKKPQFNYLVHNYYRKPSPNRKLTPTERFSLHINNNLDLAIGNYDDLELCYYLTSPTNDFHIDWNFLYCDYTPLMIAAIHNNLSLMQFLLSLEDIDVNKQNIYGETAIMLAASYDNHAIVEKLLDNKRINIGLSDFNNLSLLSKCILSRNTSSGSINNEKRSSSLLGKVLSHPKCAKQISQENLGQALISAIVARNIGCLNCLLSFPNIDVNYYSLSKGVDIFTYSILSSDNIDFFNPIVNHASFNPAKNDIRKGLFASIMINSIPVFQALLTMGGDVNSRDPKTGHTLLTCAIYSSQGLHSSIEAVINDPNFDISKSDIDCFPLFSFYEHDNIFEVKYGNNRNNNNGIQNNDENRNNENNNSQINEVYEFNKELSIKLIEDDIFSRNAYRTFPKFLMDERKNVLDTFFGNGSGLTYCIFTNNITKIIQYQGQFDPNYVDSFGNTMCHCIALTKTPSKFAKIKSADVNKQNPHNGMTPLMYACLLMPYSILEVLEYENVDVNVKDFSGKTAFDYFVQSNDLDVDDDFERPSNVEEFKLFISSCLHTINQKNYISHGYYEFS